jgi:hypothetical protein
LQTGEADGVRIANRCEAGARTRYQGHAGEPGANAVVFRSPPLGSNLRVGFSSGSRPGGSSRAASRATRPLYPHVALRHTRLRRTYR